MDNKESCELKYSGVKIKALSAHIIVSAVKNLYYEIKYTTIDGKEHIGYGSYDLNTVLAYKENCFEIINSDACKQPCTEEKQFPLLINGYDELADIISKLYYSNEYDGPDSVIELIYWLESGCIPECEDSTQ